LSSLSIKKTMFSHNPHMKKNFTLLIRNPILTLIFLFISHTRPLTATHLVGGNVTYSWVSGLTYKLTATLYRDCIGVSMPASITLDAKSSCTNLSATISLVAGSGNQVTPVCTGVQTQCNGGSIYGYQEYVYEGNIILPMTCHDWKFSYSVCCRNVAITNVINPAGASFYVESFLNNQVTPFNNSPVFNSRPVSILYSGQTNILSQSTYEPDGDSLVYTMINPMNNPTVAIQYSTPFTSNNPISSSPQSVFDPASGSFTVTPTGPQVSIMAVRVDEYRNGVKIGSVMRDVQIHVVNQVNNLPVMSGFNGGANFVAQIMAGDTLKTTMTSFDPDTTQQLWYTAFSGPAGMVVTIDTMLLTPTFAISWPSTQGMISAKPYTITITVSDNNCPYRGVNTFTYLVYVNNPNGADVWPGDANSDLTADMLDILPIGIGYGSWGPVRVNATTSWTAQSAANWSGSLPSGVNFKHADCNGDGLIDTLDLLPIAANYGLIHPKMAFTEIIADHASALPELAFDMVPDTLYPGMTVNIPILLGSAIDPVNNLYGLVFTVDYDNAYVFPGSMNASFANSWLGQPSVNMVKDFSSQGKMDAGMVRIDQTNVSGSGTMGTLTFTVPASIPNSGTLSLSFSNIKAINAGMQDINLTGKSSTIHISASPLGISGLAFKNNLFVYPNPSTGIFHLSTNSGGVQQIKVTDLIGNEVAVIPSRNSQGDVSGFDLSGSGAGWYLVYATTHVGQQYVRKINISR
jgi:hypothetical protein